VSDARCAQDPLPPPIRAAEYAVDRSGELHTFLVGNLQRPSRTPFYRDSRLEWIMCRYEAGDHGEPHWHREVTEYSMVLSGRIGLRQAADGEIAWFEPGDLFMVPAGVCVKRLVEVPSSCLTIKVPSNPEKVRCGQCDRDCAWREDRS
jgi:mannose-6-phosphate isomerase-like protein (cupin superfamily)